MIFDGMATLSNQFAPICQPYPHSKIHKLVGQNYEAQPQGVAHVHRVAWPAGTAAPFVHCLRSPTIDIKTPGAESKTWVVSLAARP